MYTSTVPHMLYGKLRETMENTENPEYLYGKYGKLIIPVRYLLKSVSPI